MTERNVRTEPSEARVGVVIAGAGSGRRLGGVSKALLEMGGRSLLEHSLAPFLAESRTAAVVVALPPAEVVEPPARLVRLSRVKFVGGGKERAESVKAALETLPTGLDVIAVHDAARPLVTEDTVTKCFDLALTGVGAVAGIPVVDSMKRVDGAGRVLEEVEREYLWHAHTPQCFPADFLLRAYRAGFGDAGSAMVADEASLAAHMGFPVVMVAEDSPNPKITYRSDLELAEAVLSRRR